MWRANSMKAAGFFSLATSKCPPGRSTVPSPRDPFGSDHARAISPRPSTARSIDATTFNASGSMSSTRGGVSWSSKMRPRPSAQTASIGRHAWEPSNLRDLRCCSYASRFRPPSLRGWENQAIFATRSPTAIRNIRPFRPRRKQIPETSRVARRPRGALEAGSCSTCRLYPWSFSQGV